MRPATLLAAAMALSGPLGGCAGIPGTGGGNVEPLLKDLQTCHREYNGNLGAMPSATFKIVCDPVVKAADAPAAPLAVGTVVAPAK